MLTWEPWAHHLFGMSRGRRTEDRVSGELSYVAERQGTQGLPRASALLPQFFERVWEDRVASHRLVEE